MIREYMGVLMRNALIGGQEIPERTLDAMLIIPDDAITPDVEEVWKTMRFLAQTGQKPTLRMLKAQLPGRSDEYWQGFNTSHPDLNSLRDTILKNIWRSRLGVTQERMAAMLADPKIDPAAVQELMLTEAERPMAGAVSATKARDVDFVDRLDKLKAGKLPLILTPFPRVNKVLGGGLFTGGDAALTAILGYTGTGKSAIAQQIALYAMTKNMQPHRVLYCAGESSKESVLQSFARIQGSVTKEMISEYGPAARDRLVRARDFLHTLPLEIYDRRLDVDALRSIMAMTASQLRDDIAAGKAPEGTSLLVIVDNLDHVAQTGGENEWKAMDRAAEGLMQTSRRLEVVHTLMLCQATETDFIRGRAPGANGFARAKSIATHCSNIWSIYRPTDTYMAQDSNLNNPHFRFPKTRTGDSDVVPVFADKEMGTWQ